MQSTWFKLLYEQQYRNGITVRGPAMGGRVGLTPSFLLGAIRALPGGNVAGNRAELAALLESMMRDNGSGRLVAISECANLKQPITSLTGGPVGLIGDPILLPDGSASKLYAWPHYFETSSHDIESLTEGLWKILGRSISEGLYSFRDGTWKEFNGDDLAFIRRALKEMDDA